MMQYLPIMLALILLAILAVGSLAGFTAPTIRLTTRQWDHVFNVAAVLGILALGALGVTFYLEHLAPMRGYLPY
jgi:heme/copper-type cytochrome/quinol oxidase subunit 2